MAIGGGGATDGKGGELEISAPITDGELSLDGQRPTGWRVKSAAASYSAYAICAAAGEKPGKPAGKGIAPTPRGRGLRGWRAAPPGPARG